jgi:hypothetical protein
MSVPECLILTLMLLDNDAVSTDHFVLFEFVNSK